MYWLFYLSHFTAETSSRLLIEGVIEVLFVTKGVLLLTHGM